MILNCCKWTRENECFDHSAESLRVRPVAPPSCLKVGNGTIVLRAPFVISQDPKRSRFCLQVLSKATNSNVFLRRETCFSLFSVSVAQRVPARSHFQRKTNTWSRFQAASRTPSKCLLPGRAKSPQTWMIINRSVHQLSLYFLQRFCIRKLSVTFWLQASYFRLGLRFRTSSPVFSLSEWLSSFTLPTFSSLSPFLLRCQKKIPGWRWC